MAKFVGENFYLNAQKCKFFIKTLEGDHEVMIGDYIIKGVKGEFYPCKADIFDLTYEAVECDDVPMTNFEHIKTLTIEEIGNFLLGIVADVFLGMTLGREVELPNSKWLAKQWEDKE